MELDDWAYLLRSALGLLVGVISGVLGLYFLYVILITIAVYGLSLLLFRVLFSGGAPMSRRFLVTTGLAPYVFIWLASWILIYNLVH